MRTLISRTIIMLCLCFFSTITWGQRQLEFLYENNLSFEEKVEKAEQFFDVQGRGKGTGYKQFLRWKYQAEQTLDDNGFVLTEEHSIEEFEKFKSKNSSNTKSMMTWVEKGPISATNTSTWSSHIGRLSNIAIDPNDDMHLVVTSLGGGVWKSIDEGTNWIPLFDDESTMSLQSAMISDANADHYFIGGSGIWRSLDGGGSFTKLSGPSGTIYSIIQDPNNSDIILASSSNGRVYRTTDNGNTWTNALVQSNRQFYDLDFKPGNSNIVYTAGRNGAMYQSNDNGVTWSAVSGPWNTSRTIMFAVTANDPEYIYVLQEDSGGFGALYLSVDGGANWTTQSSDAAGNNNIMGYSLNEKGGQAPRDMDIIVNPADKTEVHVAGIMTFKSTDSGVNWTQTTHWVLSNPLPFVHADIDQLIYHGSKIYVASDGGIFISSDGASSFVDKTTGLGIRQFYRISASTTEVGRVAGGSQDNGTGVLVSGVWYDFMGADGMEPCILNNDDDVVIGSIQFGALRKSNNAGQSLGSISQTQGGANGEWVTPLERDPNLSNVIYQGKLQLYKSTNAGGSWTTISNFSGLGNMDEIRIAPSNSNIIYVAYGSNLRKTSDGGATWETVNLGGLGNTINYINIHPTNADHIILAINGSNRFIESQDGGTTWASIRHNLPNIGSRSVVFDGTANNGIYVSLSKGVYFKDDSSPTSWTLMDTGLPNADVQELEIVNDKLYAGTYGRGLWELTIPGMGYTMNINAELDSCISQGTPDSLDDAFTFIVNPNGMGLGATYSISGDITASNIAYGTSYVADNGGTGFLKQDGGVKVIITDDDNTSYIDSTTVYPNLAENCYGNRTCQEAFPIAGTGTYHATGPSSGNGATTAGRSANWFVFVPVADGRLTIQSCGYGEDTNLKIHSGGCGSLTLEASSDDACSMGEGQSNYASRVADMVVEDSKVYYIEWDSRWSSDPFSFDVTFLEECIDYHEVDVTNTMDTVFAANTTLKLSGTLSNAVTAKSEGDVMTEQLTIGAGGDLTVEDHSCDFNTNTDLRIVAGNGTAIPDDGMVEIEFDFPSITGSTVAEFAIYIDITHPRVSDLDISLRSPDGTNYLFWDNACADEENIRFILDPDAFTTTICGEAWRKGYPIFDSSMLTSAQITDIKSKNITGLWKLTFKDTVMGMSGTVNEAFIDFQAN